jgi:2-dehydropantoate 2-reductase
MRIAVMGAGGIGGYVGARLAEAGESVSFIARGAHLDALRRNGLRLECPLGDATIAAANATDDPAALGPVDLVLVTVKLGATDAAARSLAPLIGQDTRIVTLQNGINARDMIARHVEAGRIAAGCTYLSARIREPGVIHSPGGPHRIVVDCLAADPVIAAFVSSCHRAIGLEAVATDDIEHTLWEKFVTLVAFSGSTCLARSSIGAVLANPETFAFLQSELSENLAVAKAAGQTFAADKAQGVIAFFRALPPETKSSMLIDLEAGRPLEMRWLQGRVRDLGRAHGIDTPATEAVVAALAPHAQGAAGTSAPSGA